jgi:hypothetical protein
MPRQSDVKNNIASSLLDATMSQVCENEQPHFFTLPAELRNVIYEDVLGDLGNKFTCFGGLSYVLKDSKSLNLWFVNRQMYQETRLLPYSMNSITAGPRTDYVKWLEQRTQEQLRAISRVHFVFDTFGISKAHAEFMRNRYIGFLGLDFDYTDYNVVVLRRLLTWKLEFPELPGLKNVRVELRSHANTIVELAEQIEILQDAKSQIELLNPGADVDIEMECQGERLLRDDVPASSTTGVRIIRFDKVWEGRGRSVSDILRGKGFARSHAVERHRSFLRKMWHSRGSLDADGV